MFGPLTINPSRLTSQTRSPGTITQASQTVWVWAATTINSTSSPSPANAPTRATHPDINFSSRSCMAISSLCCYQYDITPIAARQQVIRRRRVGILQGEGEEEWKRKERG